MLSRAQYSTQYFLSVSKIKLLFCTTSLQKALFFICFRPALCGIPVVEWKIFEEKNSELLKHLPILDVSKNDREGQNSLVSSYKKLICTGHMHWQIWLQKCASYESFSWAMFGEQACLMVRWNEIQQVCTALVFYVVTKSLAFLSHNLFNSCILEFLGHRQCL